MTFPEESSPERTVRLCRQYGVYTGLLNPFAWEFFLRPMQNRTLADYLIRGIKEGFPIKADLGIGSFFLKIKRPICT